MLEIAIAKYHEIESISRLWLDYISENEISTSPRVDWWIQKTKSYFRRDNYILLIAKVDNKIVGFIDGMYHNDPTFGKSGISIQYLYIKKEHRSIRVISRLVRGLNTLFAHRIEFRRIIVTPDKIKRYGRKYNMRSAVMEV